MLNTPEGMPEGRPNCAVVSIAAFAGVPYQTVEDHVRHQNAKDGRWKGRMHYSQVIAALNKLNKGRSAAFKIRQKMTLRQWINMHAQEDVLYMVLTTGHAQTVLNGYVMDQSGTWPINEYWGRRKYIKWACAKK